VVDLFKNNSRQLRNVLHDLGIKSALDDHEKITLQMGHMMREMMKSFIGQPITNFGSGSIIETFLEGITQNASDQHKILSEIMLTGVDDGDKS